MTKKKQLKNTWLTRFKEMPLLIKLFFVLGSYSAVLSAIDLLTFKPLTFTYFGSAFPQNMPAVWHLYALAINVFSLYVYIKRSYSFLKTYLYISAAVLTVSVANSVYETLRLPAEQRLPVVIVYGVTYALAILIFVYFLGQKKYFNKP
ncbi:hypothetical protein HZB58_01065 [Candidatus Gottesmanbacteria bacterium]|nr:hypothetical protein [Candidatus Gottesmanbacteria bacterium]